MSVLLSEPNETIEGASGPVHQANDHSEEKYPPKIPSFDVRFTGFLSSLFESSFCGEIPKI